MGKGSGGPQWEVSGLGSDPFNLMPIIEQVQKERRKKHKKAWWVGGGKSRFNSVHANVRKGSSSKLPELGKRLMREDDEEESRPGGVGKCLLVPNVPVHRRRLTKFNPAVSNELFKLELSRAWEPSGSSCAPTPNF